MGIPKCSTTQKPGSQRSGAKEGFGVRWGGGPGSTGYLGIGAFLGAPSGTWGRTGWSPGRGVTVSASFLQQAWGEGHA